MANLDFSSMTKDELEEHGRTLGIELDKRHSKLDLIDELNKHLEDEVEEVEVEEEVEVDEEVEEVEEVEVDEEVEEVEEVVEIEPVVEDIPEVEVVEEVEEAKLELAIHNAVHRILNEHIKGGVQVSAAVHEKAEALAQEILKDQSKK